MPKCIRRTLCNYTAVLDIFFSYYFILAIYDSEPIDSGIYTFFGITMYFETPMENSNRAPGIFSFFFFMHVRLRQKTVPESDLNEV